MFKSYKYVAITVIQILLTQVCCSIQSLKVVSRITRKGKLGKFLTQNA